MQNPRARHAGFKQRPPTAGLLDDFFRAGLRACEGALELSPESIAFPCTKHSGRDASLAYRCGGSTGLVISLWRTGFPFHPV